MRRGLEAEAKAPAARVAATCLRRKIYARIDSGGGAGAQPAHKNVSYHIIYIERERDRERERERESGTGAEPVSDGGVDWENQRNSRRELGAVVEKK